MSRHFRGHKSRALFAQHSEQPTYSITSDLNTSNNSYDNNNRFDFNELNSYDSGFQLTHQSRSHKPNNNDINNDTPVINEYSDSITLTNDNYKPNKALINISGFDNLSPFIGTDKSHTINTSTDNSYNDYNEGGPNNINDSDYRHRLIRQMQQSVFQQSESMFGRTERVAQPRSAAAATSKRDHFITIPKYDVADTYTPSNAQSVYLQKQSKKLFKNIDS